jgi:hypothetical protein
MLSHWSIAVNDQDSGWPYGNKCGLKASFIRYGR